jgi:uncharacterized protein YbjT (DUF2867 family)
MKFTITGSLENPTFLSNAFQGAEAVYLMEPPGNFFDPNFEVHEQADRLARNFVQAVQQSGVKRVVHISSIGAHTDQGNGLLKFHFHVEQIIHQLPADIAVAAMRPVGFYYNLLSFIPVIKTRGAIVSNYDGNDKEPWVAPGRTVHYVASEELSPNEVAAILGAAIGKPDLKWIAIPDEQLLNGMLAAGMNAIAVRGLVEMNAGHRRGVCKRRRPTGPLMDKNQ